MYPITPRFRFLRLFADNRPRAYAKISGKESSPDLQGFVFFYDVPNGGVLAEAEVFGLSGRAVPDAPVFYGFHVHENGDCFEPFSYTGGHYNPGNLMHPHHAGDMPPLRSVDGYAWMAFYSDDWKLHKLIGKSVAVHREADDFAAQPAGHAGEVIGCGVIAML